MESEIDEEQRRKTAEEMKKYRFDILGVLSFKEVGRRYYAAR